MNNIKNFLNLKKRDPSEIVYVEKIVLKKRSLFFEVFRMLTIIAVASGVVWGLSNADIISTSTSTPIVSTPAISSSNEIIGIYGTVTDIASTTITINDSKGSKYKNIKLFTADLTNLKSVHTNANGKETPVTLSLSDINIGDKITARGILNGNTINTETIIDFSVTSSKTITTLDVATSTATSTASTQTNLSDLNGQATSSASSTGTSTTPDASSTILDAIKGIANDVVGALTGTTTGTSTDQSASSTSLSGTTTATDTVPVVQDVVTTTTTISTDTAPVPEVPSVSSDTPSQ